MATRRYRRYLRVIGTAAVIVVALTVVLSFGVLAYVHSDVRQPAAVPINVAALSDSFPSHTPNRTRSQGAFNLHTFAPLLPLPVNGPSTPDTFLLNEITGLTDSDRTSGAVSLMAGDASSTWGVATDCDGCQAGTLADSSDSGPLVHVPWPAPLYGGGVPVGHGGGGGVPAGAAAPPIDPLSFTKTSPFPPPPGGSDHDGPPNYEPDPPTHRDPPFDPPRTGPPSDPPTDDHPHDPDTPIDVPEPATIVLLALGVGGTLSRRATRR
jgi:PEP-CTERM motif-containing protein